MYCQKSKRTDRAMLSLYFGRGGKSIKVIQNKYNVPLTHSNVHVWACLRWLVDCFIMIYCLFKWITITITFTISFCLHSLFNYYLHKYTHSRWIVGYLIPYNLSCYWFVFSKSPMNLFDKNAPLSFMFNLGAFFPVTLCYNERKEKKVKNQPFFCTDSIKNQPISFARPTTTIWMLYFGDLSLKNYR